MVDLDIRTFITRNELNVLARNCKIVTPRGFVIGGVLQDKIIKFICLRCGMKPSLQVCRDMISESDNSRKYLEDALDDVFREIVEHSEFLALNDYSSLKTIDIKVILHYDNDIDGIYLTYYRHKIIEQIVEIAKLYKTARFMKLYEKDREILVNSLLKVFI